MAQNSSISLFLSRKKGSLSIRKKLKGEGVESVCIPFRSIDHVAVIYGCTLESLVILLK